MGAPADLDLRRSALRSILAAVVAVVACLAVLAGPLRLHPAALLTAAALLAAGSLLLWRALPAHSPHRRFGAANQVTLARGALTALLVALVGAPADAGNEALAAIVAAAAAALDFIDGRLARRLGLASDYGARFDMETDALLILVLCVLLVQSGKAGPWVLASGLLRYVFVAAGKVLPALRRPLPPSARRRTVAAVQMAGLVVALSPLVPVSASQWLAAALVLSLVASFAADVAWQLRR